MLLSACAARSVRPAMDAIQAQRQLESRESAALLAWQIKGKIAVRRGDEGGNGRFRWQQDDSSINFHLSAPLSNQTWQLSGKPGAFTLQNAKAEQWQDGDAEALIERTSGWLIPVDQLKFWAQALRAPGFAAVVEFQPTGELRLLSQNGWTVQYQQFDQKLRPLRLKASRGDAWVKVKIDRWE